MTSKPLGNDTIVITGTLSVPRAEFARLLEDAGATVTNTITRNTTLLVMGDAVGDGKVDKAREFGVSMVSEEQARALIYPKGRPHTQKVYGSSDDLVELSGEVSDELDGGDEDTFIRFSNGTYLAICYGDTGIWRIRVIEKGRGKLRQLYGMPDHDDGMNLQAHGDDDAPTYSDVLIIESPDPIEVEGWGRKPLAAPRAGLSKAKAVIKMLEGRKGFDHWWHDIDQDDKTEILGEIARIVEGGA